MVSSAKSVARRLKYQPNLTSKLEARATTQDLITQSLVTEVNRQAKYNQSAVSAAYLLRRSLSISDTGETPLPFASASVHPDGATSSVDTDATTLVAGFPGT